ncbi:MAG: LAGLIDADG family homing endonuclease, partial [Actinomycetota bacterium]
EVPVPVSYGPAFEGERVRKEQLYVEFGGGKSPSFELLLMKGTDEVEDNKIEVVGKEIDDISEGSLLPLGILIHVAGSKMQKDFEPILERQIHNFINGAQGVMHMGSRDIVWIRIAKGAKEKGLKLHHLGDIIRAKLLADFPAIVDKVQVTIYTDENRIKELLPTARAIYHERDERVAGMTDEGVDVWYSCTLCQSFAPDHVCVISPQRLGLCGAYNWLDGKASYEINPTGPNQPVNKGEIIDPVKGQFKGVNEFVYKASHNKIERVSMYSMMEDPMTSCLVADTEIIIDDKPVKIADFVNAHQGGEEYTKSRVLTLNHGRAISKNLVAMQKFPAPRKLIKLVTKSGVELVLTPDHGVAIDRPEGLSWIRADQIGVGDRVISLKKLNLETDLPEMIDLIPDDFRVIDDELLQTLKGKLKARYGSFAAACREMGIKSDPRIKSLPMGILKRVVTELGEDWSRVKRLIRRMNRGASVVDIPQMSPELFYLMGLVASDGSITKRGKYEYFISFINTSENLITVFKDTYQQLFPSRHIGVRKRRLNPSTIRDRKVKPVKTCFHCYFNNPVFGALCERYGIKIGSRGNWNIGRMVSLPPEFISAFIAGLFDGDGSIRIRKYDGKWNIGEAYLCIEDKRAAIHLQLLLKRLGIVGNIRKSGSVYKIVMHGSALIQFAELIPIRHEGKKRVLEQITILAAGKEMDRSQQEVLPLAAGKEIAKLAAGKGILNSSTLFYYKTGRSRPVRSQVQKLLDSSQEFDIPDWMIDGDYFLDSIVKAEEVNNKGECDFVYNLTVAKTYCYIVNGGPLVKNCGCFQCIVAVLPTTNGVMVVNREFTGMTPSGMTFSTMAGMVGGGQQTPGFSGVGKFFLTSPKFISADGGFKRIVWMPKELKEELRDMLEKRAKEIGEPDFVDKIADETVATTEEKVLEFMQKAGHPALEMPPMF